MTTQTHTTILLFALTILSVMFGMLVFELLYFAEQLPAWGLLPAFFGAGVLYRAVVELKKRTTLPVLLPRVVTVEYDWLPVR